MSEAKPNDRVRLTTKDGQNTLTGVLVNYTLNHYNVQVDGTDSGKHNAFHIDNWNIEIIEPTTLERVKALKPGAVVHNGRTNIALIVKTTVGEWRFIYTTGAGMNNLSDWQVADYLEQNNWEIKYEGHEVV